MSRKTTDIHISDIIQYLEQQAPASYQESYDNAGLIVGNSNDKYMKGLICLDVTETVMQEAIDMQANLIISHHPMIFNAMKKFSGNTPAVKLLTMAIEHHINVYAMHTNLDNMLNGVNAKFAQLLGMEQCSILHPVEHRLVKLAVYVPHSHANKVKQALFEAGCGHVGNYDNCSYNIQGTGTFRALANARPYIGESFTLHEEPETLISTILPDYLQHHAIQALLQAHPYEEPAYDIYPLCNAHAMVGSGMIGKLPQAVKVKDFFAMMQQNMNLIHFKYSACNVQKKIQKIAICGGSGAFLIPDAIHANADIFISAEFRHNHYIDYQNSIILADIGHYESEIQTKYLIFDQLIKKFSNFAVSLREKNPVSIF